MIQLRIENILEERELSIYWLAKQTGIDYPILWKLIRGKMRGFPFEYIDLLCEAFDCQPGDLMVRTPSGATRPSSAKKDNLKKTRKKLKRG